MITPHCDVLASRFIGRGVPYSHFVPPYFMESLLLPQCEVIIGIYDLNRFGSENTVFLACF